jgi:prefoldin subunit 5
LDPKAHPKFTSLAKALESSIMIEDEIDEIDEIYHQMEKRITENREQMEHNMDEMENKMDKMMNEIKKIWMKWKIR